MNSFTGIFQHRFKSPCSLYVFTQAPLSLNSEPPPPMFLTPVGNPAFMALQWAKGPKCNATDAHEIMFN